MRGLFLAIAALLCVHVNVSAQERIGAPAFTEGDFWQYRVIEHGDYMKTERELNGIYEVVHMNARFKVFKVEAGQRNEVRSGAGVLSGLFSQSAFEYLQFPLYSGKSWTTDYTFRPRRREVDRIVRAKTEIADFVDLTIGSQTFKAFQAEREARFKNVDHWIFVYYWSPQTKSVVKYDMEVLKGDAAGNKREIELITFGSAR